MLSVKPLSEDLLKACSTFLFSTELGKNYYPVQKFMDSAIEKAYQTDSIYMAYENEHLAGVLWYVEKGAFYSYPYLHMIAVDESCRGKGYGKQLLAYMEEKLLEKKPTSKIYLVVNETNEVAKKMYASVGYKNVGRMEGLYRRGINELLMEKFLSKMTKIRLVDVG